MKIIYKLISSILAGIVFIMLNPFNENLENYNAVHNQKEEKLEELKKETQGKPGGEDKVAEMEEIVQEMYITYWNRIDSTMLRFVGFCKNRLPDRIP
ncbi:MAG: hypothetical protein ACI4D0_07645 [Lachnospira sp.]